MLTLAQRNTGLFPKKQNRGGTWRVWEWGVQRRVGGRLYNVFHLSFLHTGWSEELKEVASDFLILILL